jgi:outer membrane protein OmpA-like peptidoglycan-associated protein
MLSMIKNLGVLLGIAGVAALSVTNAHAAGPTPDGLQGLLRVHSAEPAAAGYLAGSLFGAYAREWYSAAESPRNRSEKVNFGGGFLSVSYSPTPFVELAVRGTVESQFVDAYNVGESESKVGAGDLGFHVKALLTPQEMRTFMVGAEGFVQSSLHDENALVGTWNTEGVGVGGRVNVTAAVRDELDHAKFQFHANGGYIGQTAEFDSTAWAATAQSGTPPRSTVRGNQFLYGAGVEAALPKQWSLFTEWSGEYDTEAGARFEDNPMRVTPGVRWTAPGGAFGFAAGYDIRLSSDESSPPWQVISGISLGGHVTPVQGQILGVVRDEETGEPIANASVQVRNSEDAPSVSDGQGRFKSRIVEGYAVLELSAEGYNPKTRVVEIQGHSAAEIDFTMTKRNVYGSVRGSIRDALTGAPLFGRVRVAGTEAWVESDPATGSYFLERVPEGETTLEFTAAHYQPLTTLAKVVAGDLANTDASLARDLAATMGVISGYVHDAKSGLNLAATITARGKTTKTATVDPETGLYELELEAGTYNLSVASNGYVAQVEPIALTEKQASVRNFDLALLPKKMTLKGVFFDSGQATIKRESFAALEEAAEFLFNNESLQVVIEGHTDSRGTLAGNLALSQRRADAVLKYLVVNHGIDPKRLSSKGVGSNEPIAGNDSDEGRALNRRIEFRMDGEGAAATKSKQ